MYVSVLLYLKIVKSVFRDTKVLLKFSKNCKKEDALETPARKEVKLPAEVQTRREGL